MKSALRTNAARKVGLVLLVPLFLIGCSTNFTNETFSPVVLDDARMLDKATADWLKSYSYPSGFAFVVRSVDKLPIRDVGSQADELFEKDALKCPKPDACKARGVYILISREPSLIQVRVGSELARNAQWAGITAGNPTSINNYLRLAVDLVRPFAGQLHGWVIRCQPLLNMTRNLP